MLYFILSFTVFFSKHMFQMVWEVDTNMINIKDFFC